MITDAIVSWILGGLAAVFTLVPSWSPPTFDTPPTWLGYAMNFDNILPVGLLMVLVLASLVISAFLFVLDLGFKVYHQFWGSN